MYFSEEVIASYLMEVLVVVEEVMQCVQVLAGHTNSEASQNGSIVVVVHLILCFLSTSPTIISISGTKQ